MCNVRMQERLRALEKENKELKFQHKEFNIQREALNIENEALRITLDNRCTILEEQVIHLAFDNWHTLLACDS